MWDTKRLAIAAAPMKKFLNHARRILSFQRGALDHTTGLTLRANAAWFLEGTAFYAASQWLLVIVFARLDGPGAVGIFTMATAIAGPIIALSQLSLRQVMVIDVAGRFTFSTHLYLRLILTSVAILFIFGTIFALGYRTSDALALAMFGMGRACESVSDIYYGKLQSQSRLDRVAQFLMLRAILTLALTSFVFWQTRSLVWAGLAFFAASFVSQFVVQSAGSGEPADHRRAGGGWRSLEIVSLARHAAPLAICNFLVTMNAYAPRFVLERIGGTSMVGQYAAVEYFLSIGLLFVAALGQASLPKLARAFHASDRREFFKITFWITCGSLAVGIGGVVLTMIFGSTVLNVFYGPAFRSVAPAFTPIVLGGAVGYAASILGYVVAATGQFSGLTWRYAIVLVTTSVVGLSAGSIFGVAGMGAALAAGGGVNIILALDILRKFSPVKGLTRS